MEQNLYKFVFTNENGAIANVVACSNKKISEDETLEIILKEVASNYCDDNHYQYDESRLSDYMVANSVQKLGTFRPDSEDYCNDDFTIISLNKTKLWKK